LEIRDLLTEVGRLKGEIDALRPIDPAQERRVMQRFRLDWTYHSNAIEGNTLTYGETKAFLLHGVTAQGKPFRDYLEVKGHHEAINYLLDFVRQQQLLTEAAVRELHKMILVEPYKVDAVTGDGRPTKRRVIPGQYKTAPNHVLTSTGEMHYYATPEETPAKMGNLIAWYRRETDKAELHPLILAATFHYQFVAIHPFDDGNGRMARLLMNLIFLQYGYPPVIIPTDKKGEYLLALETADAENNLDPFVIHICESLLHSLDLFLRGARGERIDELDDLDKKLAILQKKLEVNDKARPEKTAQSLLEFNDKFLEPFLSQLFSQLAKFDQFFARTFFRVTLYKENIPKNTYYHHSPVIYGIANSIREGEKPKQIEIICEWSDFMADELFHLLFTLDIYLQRYSHKIIGFAHNYQNEYSKVAYYNEDNDGELNQNLASLQAGKGKTLLKGRYDAFYSKDEIDGLILKITNELYKRLEQKTDE
jgi:Fic family protein